MILSVLTQGFFANISFLGNGTEWESWDPITTQVHDRITALHGSGHYPILINMQKVERIDTEVSKRLVDFMRNNPTIKLGFYNVSRFATHSFVQNGMDVKFLFLNQETAIQFFAQN